MLKFAAKSFIYCSRTLIEPNQKGVAVSGARIRVGIMRSLAPDLLGLKPPPNLRFGGTSIRRGLNPQLNTLLTPGSCSNNGLAFNSETVRNGMLANLGAGVNKSCSISCFLV